MTAKARFNTICPYCYKPITQHTLIRFVPNVVGAIFHVKCYESIVVDWFKEWKESQ